MTKNERAAMLARMRAKQPDEIERRKNDAEAKRAEHEQYWLTQEREKYGLAKPARPLSRMAV